MEEVAVVVTVLPILFQNAFAIIFVDVARRSDNKYD
jgi:hypothetical protein